MSKKNNSARERIVQAFEKAEEYSWVFYLIILTLLIPFRIGIIEADENIIDVIIVISMISITAQAVNKIRNRSTSSKPFIMCLRCNKRIESVGEWKCKNCGWSSTFPDN